MQESYSPISRDTRYQQHVHRSLNPARVRIIDALQQQIDAEPFRAVVTASSLASKLLGKLTECCRWPSVVQHQVTGEVHVSESRCRSRICPRCGKVRTRELGHRLRGLLAHTDSPRMLTLTLKSNDDPLAEQLRHLSDSFRKLRRRREWKKHVTGGLFVVEITWNHSKHQWHPHIHALIDGEFWKQSDIADQWEVVTDDSRIVDIRMIYGREAAVGYVTKYISKSQLSDHVPVTRIVEWAENTHGARMVGTFGKLHGVKIEKEEEETPGGYDQVAPLEPLLEAAERGEEEARQIKTAMRIITRRRLPDGSAIDDQEYERRCRETADRLRAWWAGKQELPRDHDPPESANRRRVHHPDQRSKRLWEEPDGQSNPVGVVVDQVG